MNHYRLISAILRGPFLIEERYAHTFVPMVMRMLNHEKVSFYAGEAEPEAGFYESIVEENRKANLDYFLVPEGDYWKSTSEVNEILPGSIHMCTLSGAVMKDDWCGVPGTKTLKSRFQNAQANPNVIGSIFSTDTGGGHVDGTFEFVDVLANYGKPLIGFVDGMSCSAGYAMMAACTELVLCHDTAEVGSIGTAVSFWNYAKYYEKEGMELIYINAPSSPDKNQDYFQALEKNFKPMEEDLEYLNQIFKASVTRGRTGISKEAMTGKTFRGNKAISLGMADHIGDLQFAIDRLTQIAT